MSAQLVQSRFIGHAGDVPQPHKHLQLKSLPLQSMKFQNARMANERPCYVFDGTSLITSCLQRRQPSERAYCNMAVCQEFRMVAPIMILSNIVDSGQSYLIPTPTEDTTPKCSYSPAESPNIQNSKTQHVHIGVDPPNTYPYFARYPKRKTKSAACRMPLCFHLFKPPGKNKHNSSSDRFPLTPHSETNVSLRAARSPLLSSSFANDALSAVALAMVIVQQLARELLLRPQQQSGLPVFRSPAKSLTTV